MAAVPGLHEYGGSRDRLFGLGLTGRLFGQVFPGVFQLAEKAGRIGRFGTGFGFLKFTQYLPLLLGQPGRSLDLDLDHHIAVAATAQDRHAGAALVDLLAALDAGGDADRMFLAVESGNGDFAAECGQREADRSAGEQGGALAFKNIVPDQVDENIEIAGRPVSTPAGISTCSVCGLSTRPSP